MPNFMREAKTSKLVKSLRDKIIFNPFISITPSKPLMSSGSWLTLHYCDIYYLSAVNYDPVTTDLILIWVSIYPGPGKGGFTANFETYLFYQGHYLPCNLPPQY
jgi:hypothetical protein